MSLLQCPGFQSHDYPSAPRLILTFVFKTIMHMPPVELQVVLAADVNGHRHTRRWRSRGEEGWGELLSERSGRRAESFGGGSGGCSLYRRCIIMRVVFVVVMCEKTQRER